MNRVAPHKPPVRRANTTRPAAPGAASARAASVSEAVVRMRKVLELELRRGCDDGAVIGGVDRFLATQRTDKQVAAVLDAAPKLTSGYHGLSQTQRQAWLSTVIAAKPVVAKAAAKKAPAAKATPPAKPSGSVAKPVPPADPLDNPVTVIRGVKAGLQARLRKLGGPTGGWPPFPFP